MLTDTQTAHTAEGGFFSRMMAGLAARYAQHAAYRKCVAELAALNDRELRDLGLHRSMIRSLAHEAAYRNI
ncbi:DUF1127 domain-containing protein [Pseudooceanicola sp. MF1-13]|uniref:DUF1127 domain-containing protein n=1 Tax=Pseudooceanicola sp. MF1-13 TaxID=3379095 RepID=UPI003891B377